MNVSSVKNLNGEVLSAVQDAYLTNVVQTNSGNWKDITAYQNASATYLTGVSIPESATWNEVSTTVQSNSAQWAEGGTAIPVSNSGDLYKVEFNGVDLYGYKSTTTITSEAVYSALSSHEVTSIQCTPLISWNNDAFRHFEWVGFDVISISSNGENIYPSEYGNDGLTAFDVYYKADYLYDYNNRSLPTLSGYIGKITLDNLVISSYIDKPSYFDNIKSCDEFRLCFSGNTGYGDVISKYICSVGKYVQSEPKNIEGIFVIPHSSLPTYEYDNTNKISAINGSALAGGEVYHDNTLSGNGMTDSPLGVILSATNDANVNNIIVTASLPSTPDSNTLYLIPET